MRFELVTEQPIDTRKLYDRTHIVAIDMGDNRYSISYKQAEEGRNVKELERFIRMLFGTLSISYKSLTLIAEGEASQLQFA